MRPIVCPSGGVLRAYHARELSSAEATAIAEHLGQCPRCAARAREFETLAEPTPVFSPPPESEFLSTSIPQFVGRYQILMEVARGGMGVVYQALQYGLNRRVAIKMILTGRYASDEERMRFRLEGELLARLRHPNIVQVYETGQHDGHPYLALEWVEGGSLNSRLAAGGLPAREAAALVEQLARAVHYAHQNGVIHRDLKPANVLLAADGTPKITDFGLARPVGGPSGLTVTGAIVGTPNYMAPEQARGGPDSVGPPTDVYALGGILFALLTGRPPFVGPTPIDTLQEVLERPAPSAARLRAGVPRDLATICARCLEKEPGKRYLTAADLAADLRRWLDGRPIHARRAPFWERAWLAARRRPVTASLIALVVLSVTTGATVAGWQAWEAHAARAVAESEARAATIARGIAESEARAADQAQRDAERREARLAVENGLLLCEGWEVDQGLLWLVRGAEIADRAGDPALAQVARANVAAWSARVPRPRHTLSRVDLPRLPIPVLTPAVEAVAFNRTGEYLVTGGKDTNGELWRVTDGKMWNLGPLLPTSDLFRLPRSIKALQFSPIEDFILAIGHQGGFASIWDVTPGRTPRRLAAFEHPQSEIWSVAFSPDGRSLLTGCEDGIARIWDIASGRARPLVHDVPPPGPGRPRENGGPIQAVAYVPPRPGCDGPGLVISGARYGGARLWREDGTPLRHIGGEGEPVYALAAAWAGDRLRVLVGGDRTAQFWEIIGTDTGSGWEPVEVHPLSSLLPHASRLAAAGFTADGRLALTGEHDGWVHIWDVESGHLVFQTVRHDDQVRDAKLSPDGRQVAVGGLDGLCRVWDLPPLPWSGPTLEHRSPVVHADFTANGEVLAVSASEVVQWHLQPVRRVIHWRNPSHRGRDGTVKVAASGRNGAGLFLGCRGPTDHQVWGPAGLRGKPVGLPQMAWVDEVAVTPDGRGLLTLNAGFGSRDASSRRWDLSGPTPKLLSTWEGGALVRPQAVAFRPPDGQSVWIGCGDRSLRWLDGQTGQEIGPTVNLPSAVTAIGFSADGRQAATGCRDGTVRLWDVETRRPRDRGFRAPGAVKALSITEERVIVALADRSARVWDMATGLQIGPAYWHRDVVVQARFAPDGRSILTASHDRTVRLWQPPPPVPELADLADEVRVLTGLELDRDGVVRQASPPPQPNSR